MRWVGSAGAAPTGLNQGTERAVREVAPSTSHPLGTVTPLGAHRPLPAQERLHEEGSELRERRRVGNFHKTSGDPKRKVPRVSAKSFCVPRFKRPALFLLNENIYIKYTSVVFLNSRCGN